ncbi:TPA: hypothetical protein ACX3DI_004579 [Vibrio parahaemolyticus]
MDDDRYQPLGKMAKFVTQAAAKESTPPLDQGRVLCDLVANSVSARESWFMVG